MCNIKKNYFEAKKRNYEYTLYPNIYYHAYWGGFTTKYNTRSNKIVINRTKCIEKYNVVNYKIDGDYDGDYEHCKHTY